MRGTLCLCLVVLSLACSRRGAPPAAAGLGPAPGPALTTVGDADDVPAGMPVYQGRTAPQWAQKLDHPDRAVRQQAGTALRQLGAAGYDHLYKAIDKSPSADVRLAALHAVYKTELVSHESDMIPLLIRLLESDPNAAIREQAAIRLAWFDARGKGALPALQAAAQRDPDLSVRQAAANSQLCVHEAATGTIRKSD